ncbi:MAG TPA: response regulator [Bacteroidetes bacterium]|nr:response regulator [Bacteroidota bacterium]
MSGSKLNILVIDGEYSSTSRLFQAFHHLKCKFPVKVTADAREALKIIETQHRTEAHNLPRIILLNLDLSYINGIELRSQLSKIEDLPSILVYLFTKEHNLSLVEYQFQHAIAGYILYPFETELLEKKVSTLIRFWEICEF